MTNHQILSVKQLAEYLDMATVTIYRLANRGELPGAKVGGQWRFHRQAVDQIFFTHGTGGQPTLLEMTTADEELHAAVHGLEESDER